MAFFMQALDATILNTPYPQSLIALIVLLSRCNQPSQLYADGGDAYSGKRMASRSLGTRRIFTLAVSLFTLGSLAAHFLTRYHSWLSSGLFRG